MPTVVELKPPTTTTGGSWSDAIVLEANFAECVEPATATTIAPFSDSFTWREKLRLVWVLLRSPGWRRDVLFTMIATLRHCDTPREPMLAKFWFDKEGFQAGLCGPDFEED